MLSAVASLNLETFMSNTKKGSARRGGAPPRHRPRKCSAAAVVVQAYPTSQVQPTCLLSRRKTCRGSQTFKPHPHYSNLRDIQTSWNIPEDMTWSSMGSCKNLETLPNSSQGSSSKRRLPAADSAKTTGIVSQERH